MRARILIQAAFTLTPWLLVAWSGAKTALSQIPAAQQPPSIPSDPSSLPNGAIIPYGSAGVVQFGGQGMDVLVPDIQNGYTSYTIPGPASGQQAGQQPGHSAGTPETFEFSSGGLPEPGYARTRDLTDGSMGGTVPFGNSAANSAPQAALQQQQAGSAAQPPVVCNCQCPPCQASGQQPGVQAQGQPLPDQTTYEQQPPQEIYPPQPGQTPGT